MCTKAKPAGVSGGQRLVATDWKPHTQRGVFSIVTPDGLKIKGVTLHEEEGWRSILPPAEVRIAPDGSMNLVEIIKFENDEDRQHFCDAALHAILELLEPFYRAPLAESDSAALPWEESQADKGAR